ncbi:hypothetical protein JHK82_022221 [Glycine max]|uniref:At4g15545-like C-terminal domain-containing protein n=1 Tax=Glycine soja TaxID=3848 RepID=A0A445JJ97_GLYSO|nr:uncharacterized protein At4g15545-like [Glycine soja]XP_028244901.1 uncharacterized protein At4g15545-like [Glycine soja]KAG5016571.1 hypothetical protein JHK85_022707 [Glycine max]KAG5026334.1 hypothetical protein JHK86_022248 [Glycine max]KAG5137490.1 hypothetical protein JHK82_022221 [Glycine max]RZB98484.1 hypothetical protein D0Y65_021425 [Glycine soja]RZB98485.1 hypothetical protein D0Y65_021425 [Glycine soja]
MSSQGTGSVVDFDLPDEILSVIPTDPYQQLDLARKITSMAIASRVSSLESDASRLRQKLLEKDRIILDLEDRLSSLTRASHQTDSTLNTALNENIKLSKERDQLAATVKKLSRDFAKLETFKKQLMQSLTDDNASHAETIDIGTCDQSVPKAYPDKDDDGSGYMVHHSYNGPADVGKTNDEASRYSGQRFSLTPYITPRLTPTGTPKVISTAGSPREYSAAGSPKKTSGATSPTKLPYDGRTSLSSWYSSSQQSSAANSPPRGRSLPVRTPKIDGKEFFRQARSRLSYEQFSAFLANIKELNAQKQTREETLRKADEIFGSDNKDLYLSFQGLLNRNAR